MAMPVMIGPFGGDGGVAVNINSNELPKTLHSVEIWSSADVTEATVIKGISFKYTDTNDIPRVVTWGTTTDPAATKNTVPIDTGNNDYLYKIEGTVDKNNVCVSSLKFTSKQGKTQTCGNPSFGNKFTVPLVTGGIFGFFGRAGTYINALGFYAQNP